MTLCVLGCRNKDGTAELADAATRRQLGAQDGQREFRTASDEARTEQHSTVQHNTAQHSTG